MELKSGMRQQRLRQLQHYKALYLPPKQLIAQSTGDQLAMISSPSISSPATYTWQDLGPQVLVEIDVGSMTCKEDVDVACTALALRVECRSEYSGNTVELCFDPLYAEVVQECCTWSLQPPVQEPMVVGDDVINHGCWKLCIRIAKTDPGKAWNTLAALQTPAK